MIRAVKKTWVAEEDKALLRLIEIHGLTNWSLIAASMDSRTGKQCRERYFNHLQPNIKKGNWTDEEDQIIVSMQAKIGNQWSAMTKYLPGRTDNAIKNRWHAIVKSQTQDNPSSGRPISDQSNILQDIRKNVNVMNSSVNANHQFSFKMHNPQQMSAGFTYFGPSGHGYMPHEQSLRRNYTPFEPPAMTDQDTSPFKPSQMPAMQMNPLPTFENFISSVGESTADVGNNASLDFLSYFFEKDLENKDPRADGSENIALTDKSFFSNNGSVAGDVTEPTVAGSNLLPPAAKEEFFSAGDESNDCGLSFDFSRVSLDWTLDDNGPVAHLESEYEVSLPSPVNYKNLSVSIPISEDYTYLPLSHRPRTPRSPVLLDLKRARF